jgi:hypothetical protein
MARMDPRQRGLFGAAWTLAAIAAAAEGGLAAITPAALAGEFGIAHAPMPWEQPWFDEAGGGTVFPVFHVVAAMAAAAGAPVMEATSSDPARVVALAHGRADGGVGLWLANLTETPQRVVLSGISSPRFVTLDEASFAAAARDPGFAGRLAALDGGELALGPYATVHIEGKR